MNLRIHPVMLFSRLKKFLFLLLLPVATGMIRFFLTGQFPNILLTELALLLALLCYSFLEWKSCRLQTEERGIFICKGFLFRRQAELPRREITSVTLRRSPIDQLCGASSIRFDTEAGGKKRADFELYLWKRDAERLLRELSGEEKRSGTATLPETLFTAFSASRATTGLLLAAPVVKMLGSLAGRAFTDRLYHAFQFAAARAADYIPQAASAAAVLLLAGWSVSFLILCVRYARFRVARTGQGYLVTRGIFTRRSIFIRGEKVSAVLCTQSFLMRLLGLEEVQICTAGYGKEKGETTVLLPVMRRRKMQVWRGRFLESFREPEREMSPLGRALMGYILWPLIFLGAGLLLTCTAGFFTFFEETIRFAGAVFLFAGFIRLWVKLLAWRSSGLAQTSRGLLLCSYGRGRFYRVWIAARHLASAEVSQSLFQTFGGICSVFVSPWSESGVRYRCRGLEAERTEERFAPSPHAFLRKRRSAGRQRKLWAPGAGMGESQKNREKALPELKGNDYPGRR